MGPFSRPGARTHARCTASLIAASLMPRQLLSTAAGDGPGAQRHHRLAVAVDPAEDKVLPHGGRLESGLQVSIWAGRET
jgi:hypothetical protein